MRVPGFLPCVTAANRDLERGSYFLVNLMFGYPPVHLPCYCLESDKYGAVWSVSFILTSAFGSQNSNHVEDNRRNGWHTSPAPGNFISSTRITTEIFSFNTSSWELRTSIWKADARNGKSSSVEGSQFGMIRQATSTWCRELETTIYSNSHSVDSNCIGTYCWHQVLPCLLFMQWFCHFPAIATYVAAASHVLRVCRTRGGPSIMLECYMHDFIVSCLIHLNKKLQIFWTRSLL